MQFSSFFHSMSLDIDIQSWKFSDSRFFLSKSIFISWRMVNIQSSPTASWCEEHFWDLQFVWNWICVDTNFCLRPLDHVIVEQCWSCPWGWWIIQAFSHSELLQNVLFQNFEWCWTHSRCSRILCSCRYPNSLRNLAQSGWLLFHRRCHMNIHHVNT